MALSSPSKYAQTHGDPAKLSGLSPDQVKVKADKHCGCSMDEAARAFKGDQAGPSK